jgi:transcriptional regulator with XRE-family HTH domain
MQAKIERNLPFVSRLEKLRLIKGWTWDQVGEKLGLSRTMLHFIRTGKNPVSKKTEFKLLQAEVTAELRPSTDLEDYLLEYNEGREPWGFFPNDKENPESEFSAEELRGLGQRLRWRRESKRISREVLAKQCNCEAATIEKIESGGLLNLSEDLIGKLCGALDVSDAWLKSGFGFMSGDEVAKFKSQRKDFPALQMLSPEELSDAYKHFEKEISKQTGGLKSIYIEFARRIDMERLYRMRSWEHKEQPPD